ncbi:MAG TPA: TadE family protein [Anaerolineales bacterium]
MSKRAGVIQIEKGQSLIELAISATFLLVLLAGLVDLGHAIFYYLSMRDAAQEGMVLGVIHPTYCSQIANVVQANMNDPSIQVDIQVDGVDCDGAGAAHACASKTMVVTVRQDNFPVTMPFLGSMIGTQNLALSATVRGTIMLPECA